MKNKVAILAIMKDESPYLLEWVAYHKALGFDIIIADNGGSDDTSLILSALHKIRAIIRIDYTWKKSGAQIPAYRALIRMAKKQGYKYAGFMDGDEFFTRRFPIAALSPQEGSDHIFHEMDRLNATQLSFHWICYGSKTDTQDISLPCLERFSYHASPETEWNKFVKSFFLVKTMFGKHSLLTLGPPVVDPHTQTVAYERWFIGNKQIHSWSIDMPVSYETGAILHYIVKTSKEYSNRTKRGDVIFTKNKYGDDYFQKHDYHDIYTPISPEIIECLKEKIQELNRKIHPFLEKNLKKGVGKWRAKILSIGTSSYDNDGRIDTKISSWFHRILNKRSNLL